MRKLVLVCLGAFLPGCGGSTAQWVGQLGAKDSAARLRAVKALGERLICPLAGHPRQDADHPR